MPELRDLFAGEPEPPDEPGYTEEETTVGAILTDDLQKLVDPLTLKIPIIKRDYQIMEKGAGVYITNGLDYLLILNKAEEAPEGTAPVDWPIATEYSYVVEDGQQKGGLVYTYMADGVTVTLGQLPTE